MIFTAEVLLQGVRGKERANYELRLKAKSGKELYLLLNATTRRDQNGQVMGVIGIAQDITGAKERESEIDRLLREANQLIETANAPIFGVDTDLRINEWNLKAEDISEYSKEETMGKPFLEFLDETARPAVEGVLMQGVAGSETANYELQLKAKKGGELCLLLNATTRRDMAGRVIGVIGIAQDITEQKARDAEIDRLLSEATQLIETANAPIFGVNAKGEVTEWNRKAADLSGFT